MPRVMRSTWHDIGLSLSWRQVTQISPQGKLQLCQLPAAVGNGAKGPAHAVTGVMALADSTNTISFASEGPFYDHGLLRPSTISFAPKQAFMYTQIQILNMKNPSRIFFQSWVTTFWGVGVRDMGGDWGTAPGGDEGFSCDF